MINVTRLKMWYARFTHCKYFY